MQKPNVTVHVAAALLLAAPGASLALTSVDRGHLRAGAPKVDITPQKSELAVSTDSIRDHLFVRAVVVDDGRTCAVLAGLDLGGASNQIVDDATARASKSTGCPAQNSSSPRLIPTVPIRSA
jgi:hypothetical protein